MLERVACHAILHAWIVLVAVAADDPVRLPPQPTVPMEMPKVAPDAPVLLTDDLVYVIDADVELVVVASPAGVLAITEAKGPITVRGKFYGGTGKTEIKEFKGKHVYFVETADKGQAELLILPVGGKRDSLILRLVLSNTAPIPPPKPVDPKPDPKPEPATGLRVIFVYESSDKLTPAERDVIFSPKVEQYLNQKCAKSAGGQPEWRRWDKDVVLGPAVPATLKQLWTDTKPKLGTLPQLLIVNDRNGQLHALPATEAEALTLLKQYGGELP